MISNEQFQLQASYQPHTDDFSFSKKEFQIIEDQQKGSYPGGVNVSFDMSSLGTNGKYTCWGESILTIPLVLRLDSAAPLKGETSNAFALSLKNGYHQLINTVKCSISNSEVINSQLLTNLKIHYDIVSTWTDQDVKTIGSVMNFCGIDSSDSERYFQAANANGIGSCNNAIKPSGTLFSPLGGYSSYDEGNVSRRLRMMNTSFDPNNATLEPILTNISESQCKNLAKNYVENSIGTTGIVYYILATIPMSVIHPLFKAIPLTKNMYMKLDFTFNTNFTTQITIPAGGVTYSLIANVGNAPTCPYMISPLSTLVAATETNTTGLRLTNIAAASSTTVSIQIGKNTYGGATSQHQFSSCRIYVATYVLSATQEEEYLKNMPVKTIKFDDHMYSNTNLSNIAPGGTVYNTQLFISVPKVRGILLIPQISSTVHGGSLASIKTQAYAAGAQQMGSPMVSPFSSSPGTCAPYARVSNLQVYVGNSAWFPSNVNYGWEMYNNEILKSKTPFGNAIRGFGGGLLDQHAWETNHGYIYVSLDRWENRAIDNDVKTTGVSFTNASNITCDYHCFLIYEKELRLNISTGMITN